MTFAEQQASDDARRAAHAVRLSAWRRENRRNLGLPDIYGAPDPVAPPTPSAPAAPPPPDPALVEFERVRTAALARQAAEKEAAAEALAERQAAQQAEDDAVEAILSARNL